MTTREMIHAEIERLPEEDLEELYEFIRRFAGTKAGACRPGLLSRLKCVRIDAPEDFAAI